MRFFALLALVSAATFRTSSALVEASSRTTVTVDANAYDPRTSDDGCSPDGCIPGNTRDNDIWPNSRWSCKEDLAGAPCKISYYFNQPQDIVEIRIAFHKGDERKRWLGVILNGNYYRTIDSSGDTLGYETFYLNTDETEKLTLEAVGIDSHEWISLTEVSFWVE